MAHIPDRALAEVIEQDLLGPDIIARTVANRRDWEPFEPDIKTLKRRPQGIDKRQQRLVPLIAFICVQFSSKYLCADSARHLHSRMEIGHQTALPLTISTTGASIVAFYGFFNDL